MHSQTFRSITAVAAGFVSVVVLANGTDMILVAAAGLQPLAEPQHEGRGLSWWLLATVSVYRPFYSVVGGYLTAWLAPCRPLRHAVVLGVVGVLLSVYGAVSSWGRTPGWFTVALVVVVLPASALGGWLRVRTSRQRSTAMRQESSGEPSDPAGT
jgi:hypothetical protein